VCARAHVYILYIYNIYIYIQSFKLSTNIPVVS